MVRAPPYKSTGPESSGIAVVVVDKTVDAEYKSELPSDVAGVLVVANPDVVKNPGELRDPGVVRAPPYKSERSGAYKLPPEGAPVIVSGSKYPD